MTDARQTNSTVPEPISDLNAIQRRTLVVLAITQVVGTIGVGVAPSIGVLLAGEVTSNEAWAGLARAASTLGAALLGVPLGNLAAQSGRRIALASGWWIAAAGAALLVAAAQWSMVVPLFAGLLMIGAGSAVTLQARFAATDLAQPQNKARSLSLIVWVGTLGMVVGPNLGVPGEAIGEATGLTPFAGAFLIAAVCFTAAGLIVFAMLRPDPLRLVAATRGAAMSPPGRSGRSRQIVAELRTNPPARYAVIAILTAQVVMVSIMTMTPVHISAHGGSITIIGLTISLHIAGMYFLAPVVGLVTDRFGHRTAIAVGVLIFLSSAAIGVVKPDDTAWIIVSLILLGLGWSFVNVAASALFSTVVSPVRRASAQGGVDALSNLCGAITALAAGPLLAVSSFAVLNIIAAVILVPLAVMTQRRSVSAG